MRESEKNNVVTFVRQEFNVRGCLRERAICCNKKLYTRDYCNIMRFNVIIRAENLREHDLQSFDAWRVHII